MSKKNKRIYIRVSDEELALIKLNALQNRVTISEYVRELCFPGTKLGDDINLEFIQSIIALRGEVGKTTGLLKQAIASDKYNPATFNNVLKQYSELKSKIETLISNTVSYLKS